MREMQMVRPSTCYCDRAMRARDAWEQPDCEPTDVIQRSLEGEWYSYNYHRRVPKGSIHWEIRSGKMSRPVLYCEGCSGNTYVPDDLDGELICVTCQHCRRQVVIVKMPEGE